MLPNYLIAASLAFLLNLSVVMLGTIDFDDGPVFSPTLGDGCLLFIYVPWLPPICLSDKVTKQWAFQRLIDFIQ